MRSARTITLFSERADGGQDTSSYVVSALTHALLIGLVYAAIVYGPKMHKPLLANRYTLRHLDLNMPENWMRPGGGSSVGYPGPRLAANKPEAGSKPDTQRSIFRQIVKAARARQTIVQPDLPPLLKPTVDLPVPRVMIWSSQKTAPKTIVLPPPTKPTAAEVQPTLVRPNEEVLLADVAVPKASLPDPKLPIPASTTSPVTVHGPQLPQKAPVTASVSTKPPTPAAVMSQSDIVMQKGTVVLPPANQSGTVNSQGSLEAAPKPAKEASSSSDGRANATGVAKTGEGQGAGDSKGQAHGSAGAGKTGAGQGSGDAKGQTAGNGNEGSGNGGGGQGAGEGSGSGNGHGVRHLTLPKDGQFGSVVVGASLEDQYPEISGTWNGRLAYTVYLRVGQAKSWILQYSLPRSSDAAASGNATHLDAPWPFNEVVPLINLETLDADALMIHGFVSQAGRFEALTVILPQEFPQAKFVLDALAQWQFRPAMQNGQAVRVEVLVIAPGESSE